MSMQPAAIRSRCAAACAAALLLSACGTTGNPREGGIFWSESKAQARQDSLRRDATDAQSQADAEARRNAALRGQQDNLGAEEVRLQSELDRLMTENEALDARLRELMKRRRLGEGETTRLRNLLADNEHLRAAARVSSLPAKSTIAAHPPLPVDAVNEQNGRLHREVMILLQPG